MKDVKVFSRHITYNGVGELVVCCDCKILQLDEHGMICHICGGDNLDYVNNKDGNVIRDTSINELRKMGFAIDYIEC